MMSNSWSFRRAVEDDWPALMSLLASSSLPHDGAREQLNSFHLAFCKGELVGAVAVERYGQSGLLRSVAVKAQARSLGLGELLVQRAIAEAREAGLNRLVLLTTTAERYFPRFGFRSVERASAPAEVQRSVEFASACPMSAHVMLLDLLSGATR
jgi:amino-acid N-acetyltransferase